MVQNVVMQPLSSYGSVYKIGATENGRVIYQVVDGDGRAAGKMSIPKKDCDTFEKSLHDVMSSAPKLQAYAKKMTPEKMKKQKRMSNWMIGGCTAIGALIPMIKAQNKQIFWTALGTVAGLATGVGLSFATTAPSGALKFAKATNTISKIDVQPVAES